jgi:endonuclease-3
MRLARAIQLLEEEYGLPRWAHEKHRPMDTLIGTILSQNTSDRNSIPAFSNLRRKFRSWEKVANADKRSIASAIRSGGLANIKARRIKGVLSQIRQRTGSLSLNFLAKMPKEKARKWLTELDGVGPKTAAVTLIFGFGMPVFPVDTHIFRVSKRLGLIPKGATYDEAHELLDRLVPDKKKVSLHINMLEHGRKVCSARNPKCGKCILSKLCPSAFKFPNFRR